MTEPEFLSVPRLDSDDDFNVIIVTSGCAVTDLRLIARRRPATSETPYYFLPISADGTTRCKLGKGDWNFKVLFRNDGGKAAAVTVEVRTAQDPSTEPAELEPLSAPAFEQGTFGFGVLV